MSARLAGRLLGAAALLAALVPSAALADHPFILPSSTSLSGTGNTVTFDAAGSDHVFFFDHRPISLDTITIEKPDATAAEPLNPTRTRFRSVFDVRLDQDGTWKVASRQAMVTGSFKLDGEERRVGGRGAPPPGSQPGQFDRNGPGGGDRGGPAGGPGRDAGPGEGGQRRQPPVALKDIPAEATDVHLTEMVNTTETFVTTGAPTTTVFKPTGSGLEFQPVTHPNGLVAGETARFRFVLDGRPAPGVKVTVLPGGDRYRDTDGAVTLLTGKGGEVAVKWPAAGMYLLTAETEDQHPAEKRAETRRMTYSATLEVMTP